MYSLLESEDIQSIAFQYFSLKAKPNISTGCLTAFRIEIFNSLDSFFSHDREQVFFH